MTALDPTTINSPSSPGDPQHTRGDVTTEEWSVRVLLAELDHLDKLAVWFASGLIGTAVEVGATCSRLAAVGVLVGELDSTADAERLQANRRASDLLTRIERAVDALTDDP